MTNIPPDSVREFVIAGHGNLPKVKELLNKYPGILNEAYSWTETDRETAIQAAAQVGSVPVAEFLLSKGALLHICTAAMLGQKTEVEKLLRTDPSMIKAVGAHSIPLLPHAALSGNVDLVQMLVQNGAKDGNSFALHNAVNYGFYGMAEWLLENTKPDLIWKNYQGKTALQVAVEQKNENMVRLLRKHGAGE